MQQLLPSLVTSDPDHPLRQIVDNSSAVIYIKDLEGRYRLVNPAFERFFQLRAEQVLGRSDHELFAAPVADALRSNDLSVVSLGHSIEFEEQLLLEQRSWVYLSSKFPLFDARGRVIAVCGISTDISERKGVEDALRHVALGVSAATGDEVFEAATVLVVHEVDQAAGGPVHDHVLVHLALLVAHREVIPRPVVEVADTGEAHMVSG